MGMGDGDGRKMSPLLLLGFKILMENQCWWRGLGLLFPGAELNWFCWNGWKYFGSTEEDVTSWFGTGAEECRKCIPTFSHPRGGTWDSREWDFQEMSSITPYNLGKQLHHPLQPWEMTFLEKSGTLRGESQAAHESLNRSSV